MLIDCDALLNRFKGFLLFIIVPDIGRDADEMKMECQASIIYTALVADHVAWPHKGYRED